MECARLKRSRVEYAVSICLAALALHSVASADGHVKAPFNYKGSLEERSQEAIIIFDASSGKGLEELILKISVRGDVDRFAWVIPFPTQPAVKAADGKLFEELFNYVEHRLHTSKMLTGKKFGGGGFGGGTVDPVEVLSRELVGAYETAVVKENVSGSLNQWLSDEGYQQIENGDAVIEEYRRRGFVFCCIKVSDATSAGTESIKLHPLRFSFETGGRDGIYFPMKLTGLQAEPFDVNLYVFSFRRTLNARLNDYGYEQRGFQQKYRDEVPFRTGDSRVPAFAAFLKEVYPEKRFYLTNVQATQLDPAAVRKWTNDLWMFPVYRDPEFVPYDVRRGGPASVE